MKTTKEIGKHFFDLHQSKGSPRELIFEHLDYPEAIKKEIMEWYDHYDSEHRKVSRKGVGNKFGLNKS